MKHPFERLTEAERSTLRAGVVALTQHLQYAVEGAQMPDAVKAVAVLQVFQTIAEDARAAAGVPPATVADNFETISRAFLAMGDVTDTEAAQALVLLEGGALFAKATDALDEAISLNDIDLNTPCHQSADALAAIEDRI